MIKESIISSKAKSGRNLTIGRLCIIEENVDLGDA